MKKNKNICAVYVQLPTLQLTGKNAQIILLGQVVSMIMEQKRRFTSREWADEFDFFL